MNYLEAAIRTAKVGGRILLANLEKGVPVRYKGRRNLVTEVDNASEEAIVRILRRDFPTHRIIAEEGHGRAGSSHYTWLVDPLDGTTNYAHGFPAFCVSIALEAEGEVIVGVVYDPVRRELFTAEAGKGARLNDRPIRVSAVRALSEALLVTGFNWRVVRGNFRHFVNFTRLSQGVRRTGSAALDLCYVAAGRLDGFWEMKLYPWDTAAGSLIVTEAGGVITDFRGRRYSIYHPEILASNGLLHQAMRKVIRPQNA